MDDFECLFCKIINKSTPSIKIYEDDAVYAFLDIKPVSPGHLLVVPKKHYKNLYELPDDTLSKIVCALRDISIAVKSGTNADGINIEMNNDVAAGQVIFHAHFHIIPRFANDGLRHWPGKEQERIEQQKIASSIIKELNK